MSDTNLKTTLKTANDQFTARMFQEVVKAQASESCVLSAFSVLSPLAQLAMGATGKTHDEILTAIGFSNDNVTKVVFVDVKERLDALPELKQANKLYISKNFILDSRFAVTSQLIFDAEIETIDFQQKLSAATEINQWVESHTNNLIKDLIKPKYITPDTVSVLVNAIYFKGKWANSFDPSLTKDTKFYVTKNNTITVPMMQLTSNFKYTESKELNAKFLKLHYFGNSTSFVVALPNEVDGINDLIAKFKDPDALNKALSGLSTHEVYVSLPKFKIETTTDLKTILTKLSVKTLFRSKEARLDHVLKEPADLYISHAKQKAFIEVNEEGTTAAAANLMVMGLGATYNPDQKSFEANHPFIFFVMEEDNILFNGVFRK